MSTSAVQRVFYELVGVDKLSPTFKTAGRNAETFGTKIANVGKKAVAAATLIEGAAVEIGVQAVKAAANFQASMTKIQTQAGASAKDVRMLSAEVLKLGTTTQQGPQELADGLYHLKSLGLGNAAAMKALKQASDLAAVSGANLEETTNALGGAWRSGIKGAGSFQKTVATLNATAGAGNMRMQDLVDAMSTGILPAARTFGVSLKSVGAALALMTDEGIPAQDAATRLRMSLSLMGAPSLAASKQLAKIGLSGTKLANAMRGPQGIIGGIQLLSDHLHKSGYDATQTSQILSRAFGGGRSSSAIMTLLNNLTVLKQKQDQINGSMGKFGPAVAAQQKTASAKFALLKSNLDVLEIGLGNKLIPYAQNAVGWLLKNQAAAIRMAAGFTVAAVSITAMAIAIRSVMTIVTVARAFAAIAGGIGTAVTATRTFVSTSIAAAEITKGFATAQAASAVANTVFAVSADGAAAAVGTLSVAEKAAAIAGAALEAVNPVAWAIAGAAAIAAATAALFVFGKNVKLSTAALVQADHATGFNIAGYRKLSTETGNVGSTMAALGDAAKDSNGKMVLARNGAAGYATAADAVRRTAQAAGVEANNLQSSMSILASTYGVTSKQAGQLAAKAGVTGKELGASGQAGQQAYAKVQEWAQGAGKATVAAWAAADAAKGWTSALGKLNNGLLASQGNMVGWRTAQQQATVALGESTKGLRGNSAAALAAKQQVLQSTQAAIQFAQWQVNVKHNVGAASNIIQEQIGWLRKHAAGSKFATQEIQALEKAETRLKSKSTTITVHGTGSYEVIQGSIPKSGGGLFRAAKGMKVTGGTPGRDSVLVAAMPGEAIVDRHTTAAHAGDLAAWGVPGFSRGGIVPDYKGSVKGEGKWLSADYAATMTLLQQQTAKAAASALHAAAKAAVSGGSGGSGASVALGKAMAAAMGWTGSQWTALDYLWQRESGWNPRARNPSSGAYGIPQSLPASKMASAGPDWLTNAATQIRWGLGYISGRYGSPAGAWAHEQSAGWYDRGGVLAPGQLAKNFSRVPEVVLTKGQWSDLHKLVSTLVARERDKSKKDDAPPWLLRYVSRSTSSLDKLGDAAKKLNTTIAAARNYASTTTSNLKSGLNLSNLSLTGAPLGISDITRFETSNASAMKTFAHNINKLKAAGVDNALIRQITALGPADGNQVAASILAGSKTDIKALNAAQKRGAGYAGKAGRNAADALYDAGKNAGKGFLKGLTSQENAIDKAMRKIASRLARTLRKELKIHSPSAVTREIGVFTGKGLEMGALSRLGHVQAAASRLAMAAVPQVPYTPAGSGGHAPAAAGEAPSFDVRVFIGDQELTGIVRTEIREHDRKVVRQAKAGTGRR